ncbi:myelin-oligodendrocyte glycoprotein-like isoform X2 [Hypomesus transpacificus]|uniref:myelin-oligodendrocyte glycoprotein-like isoform X2 n=1 Tax=Hypomesus transpacificus TaxID=137520 RepID=UPI001F07EB0A|nr:myelin-oligodendrocyte glycoprotein-like isoform X2 [Hypomesus transpacificus]
MDRICSMMLFMVLCSQSSAGESQLIGSSDRIVAVEGDDVILPCSLEPSVNAEFLTVEWTRPDMEPTAVHLYKDGRNNNDDQKESYKDRTMLFEGELVRGNVSLKLSRVKLEDEGSYTCRVGQVRTTVIQLSVDKWSIGKTVGVGAGVGAFVGVALVVGVVLWKKCTAGSKDVRDSKPEPFATRKRRRTRLGQ